MGLGESIDRPLSRVDVLAEEDRRALDAWIQASGVTPAVMAEMDEWAAMLLLAQTGAGVIAVPSVVADEVGTRHQLERLGEAADVTQHFYALTVERRPRHSAAGTGTRGAACSRTRRAEARSPSGALIALILPALTGLVRRLAGGP